MLSSIIPFAWDVIGGSAKSATQQEVNTQARYISERIKYEIRNATGVNYILGGSFLSLATSNPATNPTLIMRSNGLISIKQGTGDIISLQSSNTEASNLSFTNYSSSDQKTKNVQFTFTINAKFNSQNQKYNASVTVEGDAEIRNN